MNKKTSPRATRRSSRDQQMHGQRYAANRPTPPIFKHPPSPPPPPASKKKAVPTSLLELAVLLVVVLGLGYHLGRKSKQPT